MTKKCMLPKAMKNDIHSSFACRCCDSTDDMIYIVVSITNQSEFYIYLLTADNFFIQPNEFLFIIFHKP